MNIPIYIFLSESFFLQLLYVDRVKFDLLQVQRTRPTISYWTSEMIRLREDFEQEEGGFGLREVNGPYVEEVENVSDDDESVDEGISSDVSFVS